MAKEIKLAKGKEFTFRSKKGKGKASKYPWADWLNGKLWLLERETDFPDIDTKRLPAKLWAAARSRYKVVQVADYDADGNPIENSLYVQARDMTEAERAAEDARRAKAKAALKGRKVKAKQQDQANGEATNTATSSPVTPDEVEEDIDEEEEDIDEEEANADKPSGHYQDGQFVRGRSRTA